MTGFRRHGCGCPLFAGIVPLVVEDLGEEDRGYALGDRFGTLFWVETETDSRSRLGIWFTATRDTSNFECPTEIPAQIVKRYNRQSQTRTS